MIAPADAGPARAVAGLLLAAGEGSRLGRPKALVGAEGGTPWLRRALAALREGGCAPLFVVVGACAEDVSRAVPAEAEIVLATDWPEGMSASLRAGVSAVGRRGGGVEAVLVMLVDTPDVSGAVVRRLLERALPPAASPSSALARARYAGSPGHPVLIGRDHWPGVVASARGDRGARTYLRDHDPLLVECGDLATGADIDTPEALAAWWAVRSGGPT